MDEEFAEQKSRGDFTREELLKLLSYLEGEIQARDIVIAALKSEKAKQLLHEAKYGQLTGFEPLKALQHDSVYAEETELNESDVGQMYETQLSQLEKLISVQRRCHLRSQQILAATERRHARVLRELDEEKQRTAADAAQGDDLCALLENERTRLRQQLEYEQRESDKVRKEVERLEKKLRDEKERHRSMVLFLINERKHLLLCVHEMKVQSEHGKGHSHVANLITEMRKEVTSLRAERDQLGNALDSARSEVQNLKEVVRNQEEDLTLMRNSILANTRNYGNNLRIAGDGSVVVANKGVSSALTSTKSTSSSADERTTIRSRITSSSSFPANERLSASRVPLPSSSSRFPSSTIPPSPLKKSHHGVSNLRSSIRNSTGSNVSVDRDKFPEAVERKKSSYRAEPEIEQLGAIIESMNCSGKRSASLPRNGKNGGVGNSAYVRTSVAPKTNALVKRGVIFKALGVSCRNDRNGS